MIDFEHKLSVSKKFFIAFLLAILLPLVTICTIAGLRIASDSKNDYYATGTDLIQEIDRRLSGILGETRQNVDMLAMAEDARLRSVGGNPAAAHAVSGDLLALLQRNHSNYAVAFMGTRDGSFSSYPKVDVGPGYNPTTRPWYKAAVANPNRSIVTEPYQSATGEPVVSIVHAVKDASGAVVGAVGVDLNLSQLTSITTTARKDSSNYLMLLAADGTVLADAKHPEKLFKTPRDYDDPDYQALAELASGEHKTVEIGDTDVIGVAYVSPDLGWKYISIVDKSEIMELTRHTILLLLFIGLILGGVFVMIGLFLARKISAPLKSASAVLEDIAQGGGNLSLRLEVQSGDEVGEMAHWFNQFVSKLEKIISDVKDAAFKVDQATQEVAAGSQELSQATQEQASAVEEIAATIEELASTIKHNADNAGNAKLQTREMVELADENNRLASGLVTAMQEISASSYKIGDIITTVNEVAFQTNLLALNAAVEAARAGEHGKGFAVVASEVRALAQRSADSAREVKALIEDSLAKVKTGDEMVTKAGQSIAAITNHIDTVANTIEEIAVASTEQAAGIDELNRAISQIDASTQQNAGTVEELADTSEGLKREAESLAGLVDRFTVSNATAAKPGAATPSKPAARPNDGRQAGAKPAAKPAPVAAAAPKAPVYNDFDDDFEEF